MKHQRVIFHLEDGRQKYVTFNGEMDKWSAHEIINLKHNAKEFGYGAYVADFSRYDTDAGKLKSRYPKAKIIKIVGFEFEDHDLPLNPNVIF